MADFEFSSLVTDSHRFRSSFSQSRWVSEVNERQVQSLPSLLATPDAAELVISFLQSRNRHNILWLSDSFCISMNDELDDLNGGNSTGFQDEEGEGSIAWFITFNFLAPTNTNGNYFYLYGLRSAESSSLVPVVDALCQLLSWHKTLSGVQLLCNEGRIGASLPVSVPALETFVGQAKSPRGVAVRGASFSTEQCRVLAFGCHENIKLFVSGDQWMECFASLTEALMLNQSPKRLCMMQLASWPVESFSAFLVAVENNTSLLELGCQDLCTLRRVALFRAIGRNKGLQCLDLRQAPLSDAEWKILWEESLSRHPTIRTINMKHTLPSGSDSQSLQRRDDVMMRSIRVNTVLTRIKYDEEEHSRSTMREEVLPILQFNRFRPLVEAIKQEEDPALRCRLFTMTLLHCQVCNRPAFRYLLLSENSDLLLQCIRTRQELLFRPSYAACIAKAKKDTAEAEARKAEAEAKTAQLHFRVQRAKAILLQFNRFRPVVKAIKQEEVPALRCRLFTMTLLHVEVRNRPAFRYFLLNENPDLWLQCIRTRQKMLCRRSCQLVEQLEAVVGEMDDSAGMSLPSSVLADSILFTRKRKR